MLIIIFQWSSEEEEKLKKPILEKYTNEASAYYSSARLWDDGIIMPHETRKALGLSLLISKNGKKVESKFGVFRM